MKSNLILLVVLFAVFISSCKKDDKDNGPSTSTITVISQDSTYDGNINNTQVRVFEYNSSKKLAKVKYKWANNTVFNQWDTIYYTGGQLSKVESYTSASSIPYAVLTYNYTGSVLTSVNETGTNTNGAYIRLRTFTYAGGKISAQTVTYTLGAGDGEPENFTGITFTGNNITSADLTGIGGVTLTWETTASNPYYGFNYEPDNFLNMFCSNNVLKVYVTLLPTMLFVDNSYVYTNGRVSKITDASSTPARVTDITYKTL